MPARLSFDIERQILDLNGKVSQAEVCHRFGISLPTVRRICQYWEVNWIRHLPDQYGKNNPSFKDGMSKSTIERLTRRVVLSDGRCLLTCEKCGGFNKDKEQDRHHKDRNRSNNNPSNIEILCTPCHVKEHNKERTRSENGQFAG